MSDMPAPPTVESPATEPRHSLWQAVARSVRDNVIAEFVVQAVRLGGFVVLARALGPDEFGVFRVLLVVAVLTTLSNEAGIPDALVQRKEITPAHEATAWWLSMLAAFSAVTILYFAAPIIATAMGMPKLTDGARLLCLPILLDATAVVPSARLRRALNFTALAAADIVAEVAFIGVALFVLWHKMPVWVLPARSRGALYRTRYRDLARQSADCRAAGRPGKPRAISRAFRSPHGAAESSTCFLRTRTTCWWDACSAVRRSASMGWRGTCCASCPTGCIASPGA